MNENGDEEVFVDGDSEVENFKESCIPLQGHLVTQITVLCCL